MAGSSRPRPSVEGDDEPRRVVRRRGRAAEEARREAWSAVEQSPKKCRKREQARNEAERQRDDAVAEANRWQNCAEDAEARCAAAEKAAEKSASAAAEARPKSATPRSDRAYTQGGRRNWPATSPGCPRNGGARRAGTKFALAEKASSGGARLRDAGRLAAEVDRMRGEHAERRADRSLDGGSRTELAEAKRALDRKDAELR